MGRVWGPAEGFLGPAALVDRLARGRFILLGEKHDNPDHHRLQAWLVRGLVARGRRPALALEMLTTEDTPAVAAHLSRTPEDIAGLGAVLGWEQRGWPAWSLYEPIVAAVAAAGGPIVGADLPRRLRQALRGQGRRALEPDLAARLGLDRPLPAALEARMAAEIREAHCDMVPPAAVDGMVLIQRARDAWLATALVDQASADGAILIAGHGHVRTDGGVPAHLGRLAPHAPVVALAFLEVQAGRDTPEAYAPADDRAGGPPFDYVWFTPRLDDRDPCEKFKPDLEQLHRPGSGSR